MNVELLRGDMLPRLRTGVRVVPALAAVIAAALAAVPAQALTSSDRLTAWRESSAMERIELATRFGKSFITINEGFTASYFLKCIDDIAAYGNAKEATIQDGVRECVAARLRKPDDDE